MTKSNSGKVVTMLKLIRLNLPVGGSALFTKINIALFSVSFIFLRIIYTNCPTVKSDGSRYLKIKNDSNINFKKVDHTLEASTNYEHIILLQHCYL